MLDSIFNIAATVVGIGGLIFVHELGHFLVGRWCGVRAEAFSIGFGPVLLKWTPGPTEYRLSAIPLGGYVKFLGENPGEEGGRQPDSFPAATYPRKAAIMLAGVVMNVIAALALFVGTFSVGVEQVAPVAGAIGLGSPAWEHGIETGDEFVSLNGKRPVGFLDIAQDTMFSPEVTVVLRRDGEELAPRTIATREGPDGLRRLGIEPPVLSDGTLDVIPGMAAEDAGFLSGDVALEVAGVPVATWDEVERAHTRATGAIPWKVQRGDEQVELELPANPAWRIGVLRDSRGIEMVRADGPAARAGLRAGDEPVRVGEVPTPSHFAARAAVLDPANPGPMVVERDGSEVEIPLPPVADGADPRGAFAASFSGSLADDPVVSPLAEGDGPSPAREAGITAGCRLLEIDGKPLETFTGMPPIIAEAGESGRRIRVTWETPAGERREAELDALTQSQPLLLSGLVAKRRVVMVREPNIVAAMVLGVDRTHRWVMRILGTLRTIFVGKMDRRNLAGPIVIARESYRRAGRGAGEFWLFLGILSMNLAVLNLLPIPLLDGGQLAVLTAEKIHGKPLPDRVLEGVQWAGLIMLLALMVFVLGNDIVNIAS